MKFYICNFKQILVIDGWGISCEIALIWMSLDFTVDQSILVQVMAWCHQAAGYYLTQYSPRPLSSYGVTRPQWLKVTTMFHRSLKGLLLWPTPIHPQKIQIIYSKGICLKLSRKMSSVKWQPFHVGLPRLRPYMGPRPLTKAICLCEVEQLWLPCQQVALPSANINILEDRLILTDYLIGGFTATEWLPHHLLKLFVQLHPISQVGFCSLQPLPMRTSMECCEILQDFDCHFGLCNWSLIVLQNYWKPVKLDGQHI